jgi:hypothetical protein
MKNVKKWLYTCVFSLKKWQSTWGQPAARVFSEPRLLPNLVRLRFSTYLGRHALVRNST